MVGSARAQGREGCEELRGGGGLREGARAGGVRGAEGRWWAPRGRKGGRCEQASPEGARGSVEVGGGGGAARFGGALSGAEGLQNRPRFAAPGGLARLRLDPAQAHLRGNAEGGGRCAL